MTRIWAERKEEHVDIGKNHSEILEMKKIKIERINI